MNSRGDSVDVCIKNVNLDACGLDADVHYGAQFGILDLTWKVTRQEQQNSRLREAEKISLFTFKTTAYKPPKTDISRATVWVNNTSQA